MIPAAFKPLHYSTVLRSFLKKISKTSTNNRISQVSSTT